MSFCTFAEKDDIQPTDLTPWIGWVYTFPDYRGNRYVGKLLGYAEILAEEAGIKNIYISTNHDGLYEKYGYEFFRMIEYSGAPKAPVQSNGNHETGIMEIICCCH